MSDEVATADRDAEINAAWAAWRAERDRRAGQLRHDARAVYTAMEGWGRVGSQAEWEQIAAAAREGHASGGFLLERLGAERFVEPELAAVLLGLRRGLVEEGGSAAAAMLADLAVLNWYNALRIQGWVGDLALQVEHEFFGEDGPSARFEGRYGRASGLVVEERLGRLAEQMLPLLDRANRAMIRNLQALAELRRQPTPTPTVAIGHAGQVNVAQQQVNVAGIEAARSVPGGAGQPEAPFGPGDA
jgi:hypothetical protein